MFNWWPNVGSYTQTRPFLCLKCLSLCCLWHLSITKPLNFPPIFKLPSTLAFCYRHRHGWNALIHPSRRDVYRKPARFCQSKAHASTGKATLPHTSRPQQGLVHVVYTTALSSLSVSFLSTSTLPLDKSNLSYEANAIFLLTTDLTQQSKGLLCRQRSLLFPTWHLPWGSDYTGQMRDKEKEKAGDEVTGRLHMIQLWQRNMKITQCSQRLSFSK